MRDYCCKQLTRLNSFTCEVDVERLQRAFNRRSYIKLRRAICQLSYLIEYIIALNLTNIYRFGMIID